MSESPQYHHGDLRKALLQAATDQLATQPAHKLSLRELARVLGVSRTAPYHHFKDKTALLQAVAAEAQEQFYQTQLTAAHAVDGTVAKLLAIGEAYVDYAVTSPNAFALVFSPDYCPAVAGSTAAPSPAMAAAMTHLSELVIAGQAAGELPGDEAEAYMDALWGLVHGLSSLVSAGLIQPESVLPALAAFVATK